MCPLGLTLRRALAKLCRAQLHLEAVRALVDEHVCSCRGVFRRRSVSEAGRQATQIQLHPLVLGTWWTAAGCIGCPASTGNTEMLELEDPGVVLIMEILVGDEFDVAAWLR